MNQVAKSIVALISALCLAHVPLSSYSVPLHFINTGFPSSSSRVSVLEGPCLLQSWVSFFIPSASLLPQHLPGVISTSFTFATRHRSPIQTGLGKNGAASAPIVGTLARAHSGTDGSRCGYLFPCFAPYLGSAPTRGGQQLQTTFHQPSQRCRNRSLVLKVQKQPPGSGWLGPSLTCIPKPITAASHGLGLGPPKGAGDEESENGNVGEPIHKSEKWNPGQCGWLVEVRLMHQEVASSVPN